MGSQQTSQALNLHKGNRQNETICEKQLILSHKLNQWVRGQIYPKYSWAPLKKVTYSRDFVPQAIHRLPWQSEGLWAPEPTGILTTPLILWSDSHATKPTSLPASLVYSTVQAFTSSLWSVRSQFQAKIWYRPHIFSLRAKEKQKGSFSKQMEHTEKGRKLWSHMFIPKATKIPASYNILCTATAQKSTESERFYTSSSREHIFQLASGGQRVDADRYSQKTCHQFDHPHWALGSSKSYFLNLAKFRRIHQKHGSSRALNPGSIPSCRCIMLDLQQAVPQASGI